MFTRNIPNIIIFLCLILQHASAQEEWIRINKRGPKLGTEVQIILYTTDQSLGIAVLDKAFQIIDSLNLVFSDYDPQSEVYKINSNRKKSSVAVSAPLYDLLVISQGIATESNGLFDPSLGALTHLWRKYHQKNRKPPKRKVRRASKNVGYQKIKLGERSIQFNNSKIKLDFGGIAKGYIADQIADYFRDKNINSFFIDMGGDLLMGYPPPNRGGWAVLSEPCPEILELKRVAVAGSGATFQHIKNENIQYSHIISDLHPTGVIHQKETRVMAENATVADAMATAINASENTWIPRELISQESSFFIHIGDDSFMKHYINYLRAQINLCK